jgi:hypothetical protein
MKNYHIIKLPEGITPNGMTKACVKIPDCGEGSVFITKSSFIGVHKTTRGYNIVTK